MNADKTRYVARGIDGHDMQSAEADARLIAAAPDLLEACERVLRSIDWATTEDRLTAVQEGQVLRNAIAKAKGE